MIQGSFRLVLVIQCNIRCFQSRIKCRMSVLETGNNKSLCRIIMFFSCIQRKIVYLCKQKYNHIYNEDKSVVCPLDDEFIRGDGGGEKGFS
jgi:hypothetical protein